MIERPVTGKRLTERFNKYVEYRKEVDRTKHSFSEQLVAAVDSRRSGRHQQGLQGGNHMAPPRLAHAKHITTPQAKRLASHAKLIQEAAVRHNVPVELICGVILQESGGNPHAISHAGAKGLMQLMPQTARRFGVKNSLDPAENIDGGTRYLRWLLDRYDGNIELTLAGYNAGEGAVERYGNKVPPFAETKNYIPNVLGYTQSMIDILLATRENTSSLPSHARRA